MRKCFPGHSDKRHSHFEVALSVLGEHCESEGGASGRFGEGATHEGAPCALRLESETR